MNYDGGSGYPNRPSGKIRKFVIWYFPKLRKSISSGIPKICFIRNFENPFHPAGMARKASRQVRVGKESMLLPNISRYTKQPSGVMARKAITWQGVRGSTLADSFSSFFEMVLIEARKLLRSVGFYGDQSPGKKRRYRENPYSTTEFRPI